MDARSDLEIAPQLIQVPTVGIRRLDWLLFSGLWPGFIGDAPGFGCSSCPLRAKPADHTRHQDIQLPADV